MPTQEHQVQFRVETLSLLDPNIQQKIDAWIKEGWVMVPGAPPVGIYYMQKMVVAQALCVDQAWPGQRLRAHEVHAPTPGAHVMEIKMGVDDAKVHILKGNGQIVP
jgi:hypothetical protein